MYTDIGDQCQYAATEAGDLRYCSEPVISADQIAVLIIKPSNHVLNANNTPRNIDSIVGRIEQNGWQLQGVKVFAGSASIIGKVIAHYSQPFYDSRVKDVRTQLSGEERQQLARVWGEAAQSYPIYHPVQLVESGLMDYATIAFIWHAGRGINNQLLDSGSVSGINTITRDKNARYGKRRLLLVKDHPTLPGVQPFFIVNGFTAEFVVKFARLGERIVVMVFSQQYPQHGLDYLREYVIGETNPHKARPSSIRFDALHTEEYTGAFPIASLDEVGIENNIVHFSDSLAEAYRELLIWIPEVIWYPSTGPFAPDISYATWEYLRERYLAREVDFGLTSVTSADGEALPRWSTLSAPPAPVPISVNMMAGGSAGRFFGYELPEHQRNKFYAPIVPIRDRTYSFLELQLARLAGLEYVKQINISAAESTAESVQLAIEELREHAPRLRSSINKTNVLDRRGIPRIIPVAQDLVVDPKFRSYCAKHGIDVRDQALASSRNAGDILLDRGTITCKPPGTLSVLLHYIHHCLKEELSRGIDVAFFHIGEDTGAIPDMRFLAHARAKTAVAYIGVVKSHTFRPAGYLVSNASKLQLYEASDNVGLTPPFFINTGRMAINLSALARFLASDVATFMEFDENQIRQAVNDKIVSALTPRFEIKPLDNYELWAGQFAYPIGQVSEVMPTEFILCDDPFPEILTFKTREDLRAILPIIEQAYAPYLKRLKYRSDREL